MLSSLVWRRTLETEIATRAKVKMNDHAELETVCPNNHNLTVSFSRDAFEAALKAGALVS